MNMQINMHGITAGDHRRIDDFAVTHLTDEKGNYVSIFFETPDDLRAFWAALAVEPFSNDKEQQ
jgi:hypothetical protein